MSPHLMELHAQDAAELGPFEVITPKAPYTFYRLVRKTGDKRVIGQFESRHDAYMVAAILNGTVEQFQKLRGAA